MFVQAGRGEAVAHYETCAVRRDGQPHERLRGRFVAPEQHPAGCGSSLHLRDVQDSNRPSRCRARERPTDAAAEQHSWDAVIWLSAEAGDPLREPSVLRVRATGPTSSSGETAELIRSRTTSRAWVSSSAR